MAAPLPARTATPETPPESVALFTTCPPSNRTDRASYLAHVIDVARWSDRAGCEGILVYTDNGLVDPWLVSQVIITHTEHLCPLVAVQPAYMHPYTVAKMTASLAHLYRRRIYLNMVAGGFGNDLAALNDRTPHDERYARLVEYTTIIMELLRQPAPVTFAGRYYTVTNLKMTPPVPAELLPGVFVSGSSAAGLAAAQALGATAVQYPRPAEECEAQPPPAGTRLGVRVGIVAREGAEAAWSVAHDRFPPDRKGQLTHQLAMKVSDSEWHRQLSDLARASARQESPYWLFPFENYKTFCPYLVGSYDRVAEEVGRYQGVGCRTFLMDVPASAEELQHIRTVFARAQERIAA